MNQSAQEQSDRGEAQSTSTLRSAVAGIVGLVLLGYLLAVVLGKIPERQKLGTADLGIIVLAALTVGILLRPEVLEQIKYFKLGGLEVELQKLQESQQVQQRELEGFRFVLMLLLQDSEREHLRKLGKGDTQDYTGNHDLRKELRKLRGLGLIRNRKDRHVSEMADKRNFDLKDFVELTERGKSYLSRLGELKE